MLHAVLRWLPLISTVFLASCTSSSTSLLNPAPSRCVATLAADLMAPEASGGTGHLTIGVNRECQWTAKADVEWISVSAANGQGEASLTYTVAANPAGVQRRGGLIVNDNRLEVAQRAAACTFTLSRASDSFDAAGGTRSVSVGAPSGCAWEAQSGVSWLVVVAGGGSGAGSLEFRIEANTTPSLRTGTMTVAGQTFTVSQAAASSLCNIAVSPGSQSIGSAAGSGSVNVAAPPGCAWTAASDAAWLTITSGSSGTGSGSIQYTATANGASIARTATMSIGNQAFTLTQNAAATSCSFTVSPLSVPVGSAGGVSVVAITTASSACAWAAVSNAPWIVLTSPAAGSGTSQVSFTIAANTSASPRSSSISVAGETVAVSQAAAQTPAPPPPGSCTFTLSAPIGSIPFSGGQSEITVTPSASTCTWTAASNTSWITLTGPSTGTGTSQVSFTIAANTGTSPRSGSVTIAGQTVAINQTAAPGPTPSPCTFTLSATAQSIPASGGQSQIQVTASASTCAWAASSSASWISISAGTTGIGAGTVTFAATANTSTTPRTGTLTIAGETATITQLGRPLSVKGPITALSGSCPNLTFKLDARTVHTNNDTEFSEPCNKLKNGVKVDVEGVAQIDNSVLADRVSRD